MKNTMTTTSQYKDLSEFLAKHSAKNERHKSTHTRIPDKELGVFPGSFAIPKEELQIFAKLYYENVFVKKRKEYLTERQLEEGGPMAVDFDFRYDYSVDKRMHTKEHIEDMVLLYLEELKENFIFEANKPFDVFIFEKPNVNRLEDQTVTKDGIHMIIGIQVDHIIQMMIREKMIEKLPEIWDLPFKSDCTWDKVLDMGITQGTTNWQLFGSRKPGNEAYELSRHYNISFDPADKEFMMNEINVESFDLKNNFIKLSVQNDNNPKFEMNPKIMEIYNKKKSTKHLKPKKPVSKIRVNLLVEDEDENEEYISISEIKDKETLTRAVDIMLKSLTSQEYEIKEAHEYAQILPEKYYEPGSHLLNRQLAFALKNTDDRLFLSWVMVRSKASDFVYNTIPTLHHDWKKYFNTSKEGVTRRSIMYWAKQDVYEEYLKVKNSTIEYYIEESLNIQTEFDIAKVLYVMYKDKYVCSSIKGDIWYVFKNHRWETDKGISLRLAISTEIYNLYDKKREEVFNEWQNYEQTDDRHEFLKNKASAISKLLIKLKKTTDKNNIMREAKEIFYDGDFTANMDANKYLLCFKNGVVDFRTNTFRDGYPQDYISKSTRINYQEYDEKNADIKEIGDHILTFMHKLFPIEDLNKYMWQHLASCLIGVNKNQTFNVYHGSGSNGKSILTDLMSHTLGDYKGTVPITLVTEKRTSIGGTSSEVMQLKGIRYAVMQEPSKGVKLNEGIMKELTGGDPLQARALFQESETFEPQFNLVVCTNNLFDIDSNDDGTWRRIRKCDFVSKFVDENETYDDDAKFIFAKDKSLKEKLPQLAPIFASMLVKKAFETGGNVEDCTTVNEASNKYRKGQDHIAAFVSDRIIKTETMTDRIGKVSLYQEFKLWFQQEQGARRMPKGEELYNYMEKKFGQYKKNGWHGIKFIINDETDEMQEAEGKY
jgi:P4 family phage/plasmid primase-like protien